MFDEEISLFEEKDKCEELLQSVLEERKDSNSEKSFNSSVISIVDEGELQYQLKRIVKFAQKNPNCSLVRLSEPEKNRFLAVF